MENSMLKKEGKKIDGKTEEVIELQSNHKKRKFEE